MTDYFGYGAPVIFGVQTFVVAANGPDRWVEKKRLQSLMDARDGIRPTSLDKHLPPPREGVPSVAKMKEILTDGDWRAYFEHAAKPCGVAATARFVRLSVLGRVLQLNHIPPQEITEIVRQFSEAPITSLPTPEPRDIETEVSELRKENAELWKALDAMARVVASIRDHNAGLDRLVSQMCERVGVKTGKFFSALPHHNDS